MKMPRLIAGALAMLLEPLGDRETKPPKPKYRYEPDGFVMHKGGPVAVLRVHLLDHSKYSGAALRKIRATHR